MKDNQPTARQRAMLLQMESGVFWPGPRGAATARSLVTRGWATKEFPYGPYRITDTGRSVFEDRA